ncbi:MAG: response regulator transcription factor [Clostridiales bacterium]|nr:response regulator transcription factor [Clostridiales bacterium]
MLKIFLVEDETIIREGLRAIIPWQQYGYDFAGEAGDGEEALPLIRKVKPDVLITDIRMPFMDGLALSKIVSRELPDTKIIIVSGYDDFEYAREAMHIGVKQYLLKPITKTMLIKTLQEVRESIDSEQEQKNYLEKFRSEMQEYDQFSRRRFFEKLVAGALSVEEIYERARELNLEIHAQCYNLVLYSIQNESRDSEQLAVAEEELTRFFGQYPEFLVFRWNFTTYAVLVKGEPVQVENFTARCVETIQEKLTRFSADEAAWYVAVGEPIQRLSALSGSFSELSRILSYRHLMPGQHILTRETVRQMQPGDEESSLKNLDMNKIDPGILLGFLQNGAPEEVPEFVSEYVDSLKEPVQSRLFSQYLMLNVRFTALSYVEGLGCSQEEFLEDLDVMAMIGRNVSIRELKEYFAAVLTRALELRERESRSQHKDIIRQAVEYIDQNYTDENISLKDVAAHTNVSANYLSAVFSQEMRRTFVEYLTEKRMEKAKELLRQTDRRSAEIAGLVGYKDPHYFSFVFRKTQGCTPRDYRAGGRKG